MAGMSTSSQSTNSPWAGPLGNFGKDLTKIAGPLDSVLGSQFLEALRTGGVNSFIPWITRSVDASRAAGSTSLQQLQERLSKGGLAGSSFAAQTEAGADIDVGQKVAMTPSEMIMQFIQGAPSFALGLGQQGIRALQGAGALQNTTTSTPSLWDQFTQGVQLAATGKNPGSSNQGSGSQGLLSMGSGSSIFGSGGAGAGATMIP